jgi:tetratricopeptide (TPR) repeat protein
MIQKWLVTMSLSIFLLTGLSTSSFFSADLLSRVIANNEHTTSQLNFALAQENEVALSYALKQSKKGSENWQSLAKILAKNNGEVATLLAEFYLGKKYLAESFSSQSAQATLWYQQAIRLNYSKASIGLAELYFQQGDYLAAQSLLAKFKLMELRPSQYDDVTVAAIILTIKVAISIGDITLVNSLLIKFSSLLHTSEIGGLLLNVIEKYQVLPSVGDNDIKSDSKALTCSNSIQIFATNLLHLTKAEQLVKRFKNKPLNGLVCFSPVRYLPLTTLSCSSASQSTILCDESKFDNVADSVTTRYIAIMSPEGGANVHLGILYFDAKDSVDVVEHEVSHLLGFVDEYPLGKGHVKCRTSQQQISAQNIAVLQNSYQGERSAIRSKVLRQLAWAEQIKTTTPILYVKDAASKKHQDWELGTPERFEQEVGLFRSETCDNNSAKQKSTFSAFKPLVARTKLQYDELNFPEQYIALFERNSVDFLMPSFHYNIALAYYQQNNIEQAKYWLGKAASWESDDSRRKKIRQGDF